MNHRYNAASMEHCRHWAVSFTDKMFPRDENGDVAVAWDISGIHCSTIGHVFTHREFHRIAGAAGLAIEKRYVIDYASGEQRSRVFKVICCMF